MDLQDHTITPDNLAVCVVTQQYERVISGIGLHARNLVQHLLDDGRYVCVIAPFDQCSANTMQIRFVGVPAPLFQRTQARWLTLSWNFAHALARIQRHERFDLIHFTDARESLFCRPQAPMIGNVNDTYAAEVESLWYYRRHYADWPLRWGYYRFVRASERRALRRLAAVIANSRYTARVIEQCYALAAGHVHVCHKSIEPAQYVRAHQLRTRQPPHPPRVLFVGGNMQRKGLPVLISAAPSILAELPDTEFWIVGQDHAMARMQALCRDRGVDQRFTFLGWKSQADLAALYAQADVFVLPSLTEAFGVVFLEAMAAGVPVIGTRVGGVVEIIEHGVNGMLVRPDDVTDLAAMLIRLLRDAGLRERLRQAGSLTVQRFTAQRMMNETYAIYRSVLSKGLSNQ